MELKIHLYNKTATVVRKTTDGAIWSFSIDRDDAPGFYEVTKIIIKKWSRLL